MNREIKFRIWDGKRFYFTENYHVYPRGLSDDFGLSFKINPNERFPSDPNNCSKKIKIEIQQFTGCRSKSGKDIYEGDILEWTDDIGDRVAIWKEFIGYVTWGSEWCNYMIVTNDNKRNLNNVGFIQYEIVGNIFENKDLLK
jgi:hypothetical protein